MPKFTECPHCGECLTMDEIKDQYCHECERDLNAYQQFKLNESAQEKIDEAHMQLIPLQITVHVGFAPPVPETENESDARGMAGGASDPYEPAHPSLYNHDSWIY